MLLDFFARKVTKVILLYKRKDSKFMMHDAGCKMFLLSPLLFG